MRSSLVLYQCEKWYIYFFKNHSQVKLHFYILFLLLLFLEFMQSLVSVGCTLTCGSQLFCFCVKLRTNNLPQKTDNHAYF